MSWKSLAGWIRGPSRRGEPQGDWPRLFLSPHPDAQRIVRNRDNTNALFHERYGVKLLGVLEERSILQLFLGCGSEEAFAYRVQALAGLATAINEPGLRPLVGELPKEGGSLNLLDRFLEESVPGVNRDEVIGRIRAINRLRQMFPVHVDTSKGAIDDLRLLGLEYPVRDFAAAWARVVGSYAIATDVLLEAAHNLPARP